MITAYFKKVLKLLLLTMLFFLVIFYYLRPIKIIGDSMEPTFHANSWVIINKLSYKTSKPKRGDIIVFTHPNLKDTYIIKRIIAVEEDTIQIINGKVYVNDFLLQEKYIKNNSSTSFDKRLVPKNSAFVLGDNRIISRDSRYGDIAFIDFKNIVGKIIY